MNNSDIVSTDFIRKNIESINKAINKNSLKIYLLPFKEIETNPAKLYVGRVIYLEVLKELHENLECEIIDTFMYTYDKFLDIKDEPDSIFLGFYGKGMGKMFTSNKTLNFLNANTSISIEANSFISHVKKSIDTLKIYLLFSNKTLPDAIEFDDLYRKFDFLNLIPKNHTINKSWILTQFYIKNFYNKDFEDVVSKHCGSINRMDLFSSDDDDDEIEDSAPFESLIKKSLSTSTFQNIIDFNNANSCGYKLNHRDGYIELIKDSFVKYSIRQLNKYKNSKSRGTVFKAENIISNIAVCESAHLKDRLLSDLNSTLEEIKLETGDDLSIIYRLARDLDLSELNNLILFNVYSRIDDSLNITFVKGVHSLEYINNTDNILIMGAILMDGRDGKVAISMITGELLFEL